jgi:glycosyltransferase involved in cell wall biosynthesis
LPAERLRVIYPPLDTARFRPRSAAERSAERERLGLAASERVFLFPSMGHQRKGFDLLLEACAALADAPFTLLVAGRAARQRLPARVRALDFVEDMPALYGAADATVLPSRYEPFGLAITESLACGTPVVCSAVCGAAELLSRRDGIVLKALDVPTLVAALRTLLERRLEPTPDFAAAHGITLPEHITALRALVS